MNLGLHLGGSRSTSYDKKEDPHHGTLEAKIQQWKKEDELRARNGGKLKYPISTPRPSKKTSSKTESQLSDSDTPRLPPEPIIVD